MAEQNGLSRREVMAVLASAGVLGASASTASADEVGIGGGPMSDELSHRNVRWYDLPESELPDPGVDGRYVHITEGGALWETGDVLEDTGDAWQKLDVGVGALNADEGSIGSLSAEAANITEFAQSNSFQIRKHNGDFLVIDGETGAVVDSVTDLADVWGDIRSTLLSPSNDLDKGGWVGFQVGEYETSEALQLGAHIKLGGGEGGFDTPRIYLADSAADDENVVEHTQDTGSNFDSGLYHISVEGDTSNSAGHGLYVETSTGGSASPPDIHIGHSGAWRCAEDGFHFESSWGYHIRSSLFEYNNGHGIAFRWGGQNYLDSIFSAYNGLDGFSFTASNGSLSGMTGTKLYSHKNGRRGFDIQSNDSTFSAIVASNNGQDETGDGVIVRGNRNSLVGLLIRNEENIQYNGLRITGDNNVVCGAIVDGHSNRDVHLVGDENVLMGVEAESITRDSAAVRNIANGVGVNDGNPATGGAWNGHADLAARHNATIYDTSSTAPYTAYVANESGDWEVDDRTAA